MGYICWLSLKKLEESVKGRNLPYPLLGGHSLKRVITNFHLKENNTVATVLSYSLLIW